jgi:hypothetical protein
LGYQLKTKHHKYWKDFENLKKELLPIIKQGGCFPTTNFLREIKRNDIIDATYKYHISVVSVKQIFEENNYYKNEI